MCRRFYSRFILVLLVLLFNASLSSAEVLPSIGRLPGAKIANKATVTGNSNTPVGTPLGSCNPKADIAMDGAAGRAAYEKSCSGQNITREGTTTGTTVTNKFSVKVTFDPKQPTTRINPAHPNDSSYNTTWSAGTLTVPGAPTFPMCNTSVATSQNEDTCNSTVCPATNTMVSNTTAKTTANCYALASVETVVNSTRTNIALTTTNTSGVLSYNLTGFTVSDRGAAILRTVVTSGVSSSLPVYFPSVPLRYPTSGNVKTQLMSNGVAVTSKCKNTPTDGSASVPVQSTKQPTSATDTCDVHTPDAYTPITDSNGSLVSSPVMVDLVYGTPAIPIVADPDGTTPTCTSGTTQTYANNKYIRDANCRPQKDLNLCIHNGQSDSALCTSYMVGGGVMYDISGNAMSSTGAQVMSVAGPSTTRSVSGSLYSLVFNDAIAGRAGNSTQVQSEIMGLAETTFDLYADTEVIPYPQALVSFELKYDGNKACVYAHERIPEEKWRVEGEYPRSLNEVYGIISSVDMEPTAQPHGVPVPVAVPARGNCVDAPPRAVNNTPLSWGSLISPICTQYDSSGSQFKWSSGKTRAFTGVVVECIEDTMTGIFYPKAANPNGLTAQERTTVFSRMQNNIQNMIRSVLVLYIIFFGYKIMMGKEVPKREQWMWLALKFSFIMYFALGSGMVDLLPKMLTISKSLSVVVMEAGLGVVNDPGITAAQAAAAAANDNAVNKRALANAAVLAGNLGSNALADGVARRATLESQLATALINKNTSQSSKDGYQALLDSATADLRNLTAAQATLITRMENDIQTSKNQFIQSHNSATQITAVGVASYRPPSFCTSVTAEVWGGGAAGNFTQMCTTSCDYSGGAGGHAVGVINNVSSGTTYTLSVGGGGTTIGASGGASYFYSSTALYANGGSGASGGTAGGTASTSSLVGGPGTAATCATVSGGNPYGGSGQPASSCNLGGNTSLLASPGGGGCASDDTCANSKWGIGTQGKVSVSCTTFDFTNDNNIDTTNATDVTFRDNLRTNNTAVQTLRTSNPQTLIDKQAEVTRLQGELSRANARYTTDLNTYNSINAQLTAQIAANLTLTNSQSSQSGSTASLQDDAVRAEAAANAANQALADLYACIARSGSTNTSSCTTTLTSVRIGNSVSSSNTGYSYCDFRFYPYATGKSYMKLWDMIDCKFSKYLGIGDNATMSDAPQVVLVAILAPISVAFGFPIFFLAAIFTTIIVMVIVRAVHIYIMSFIGLVLLVYISPLVIPAVLFEFTKGVFQQWLQQLMAFWLQPIILFGFLAFMLACVDTVMFGANHSFNANNRITNASGEISPTNKTCLATDSTCDAGAVAYIYQTSSITKIAFPTSSFKMFDMWQVNVGSDNGKALFIGLSKLMIISFIIYSILSMTEVMSNKLVGGMGDKGAAGLSGAPVAGPAQIMGGIAKGAVGAKNAAYNTVKGVGKAANAVKHYKSTGRAIKSALLDNTAMNSARGLARGGSWAAGKVKNKVDEKEAKEVDKKSEEAVKSYIGNTSAQSSGGSGAARSSASASSPSGGAGAASSSASASSSSGGANPPPSPASRGAVIGSGGAKSAPNKEQSGLGGPTPGAGVVKSAQGGLQGLRSSPGAAAVKSAQGGLQGLASGSGASADAGNKARKVDFGGAPRPAVFGDRAKKPSGSGSGGTEDKG